MIMNCQERQSNIELLRIISMFMVIGLHCNFVSLGRPTDSSLVENFASESIRIVLENFCLVSVNAFVIISGFFGIRFKVKKIFSYLFQVFFFASIVIIIGNYILDKQVSLYEGLKFYYSYLSFNWFVGSYFALILLAPIINSFVENNSVKSIGKIFFLFFFIDCILGFLLPGVKGIGSLNGYSFIHLLFIYCLGRLLSLLINQVIIFRIIVLVFVTAVLFNSVFTIYIISKDLPWWNPIAYNNPIVVLGSVAFFMIFQKIEIRYNKYINLLAASAFPAFLLHANTIIYPYFICLNNTIYNNYSGIMSFGLFLCVAVLIYVCAFLINQIQIRCSNFLWSFIHKVV